MKQVKDLKFINSGGATTYSFEADVFYEDGSKESFINPHYLYSALERGNYQNKNVMTAVKHWKDSFATCVHTRHCCEEHGCKYGDPDCLVAMGIRHQEYLCEYCRDDEGIDQDAR